MIIYENQVINPEKPWSFMDDTKENILKDLAEYTLDPVLEEYGNFLQLSHAFSLLTDDEKFIKEITEAIRRNQETKKYKQAKVRLMERNAEEKRQYEERIQKLNKNS